MAHKTHRNQFKKQQKSNKKTVSLLVGGNCGLPAMSKDKAERAVKLDLDCWIRGILEWITPAEVIKAHKLGFDNLISEIVNGRDSANPFFTIHGGFKALRECNFDVLVIHNRCAMDHGYAYGPVYTSPAAAKSAGHTHQCACSCGRIGNPI